MKKELTRKICAARHTGEVAPMDYLVITDDRKEKVRIGMRLVVDKPKTYTPERVKWIRSQIKDLLTPQVKKDFSEDEIFYTSVYDFWAYGNTISEEFCFNFLYKTHAEKKLYTTFRTRLNLLYKINDRSLAYIFHDKYETYERFNDYYLRDVVKISGVSDYEKFQEFVLKHPVFVLKPLASSLGRGVRKVDVRDYASVDSLFSELLAQGASMLDVSFYDDRSFIVEELIDQDLHMAAIHPSSVNAVRVPTLRLKDGNVRVLYPWVKIGANNQFVSSTAFGTYDAGIDVKTGIINTDGYKENGEKLAVHPITGVVFRGYVVPRWDELMQLTIRLAKSLPPSINYIGWDMALTPKGWCIMEANFTGDFMWQLFQERGFLKEWEELTGITLQDDFWWKSV